MAEAQGKKDLKTICMKVLEIIKERTKKSLKQVHESTYKQREETKRFIKEIQENKTNSGRK